MATLTYGQVVAAGPGWTQVTTPQGVRTVYGDRALRNNNPGNIEAGRYARSMGAIGSDGRFAVFGNRVRGTMAQTGLVFGKNYANLTLRDAIAKYAPSFENNSVAYAAAVAAAAGVSLDTKMKDIPAEKRAAVVKGMQAVEGNTVAKAYDENGNLIDTLDATSLRTPNTAPAPYGPDSQQALAPTRPDNRSFTGPKGLFSVDSQVASPLGHISRSPLGPAAPSVSTGLSPTRPDSASFRGPPGSFSVSTPAPRSAAPSISRPSTFTSQDEKTNTGNVARAPNANNFVSQDERPAFADRMGIPGATPQSASQPSPVRPDNASFAGPKGVFSVDPGAVVSGVSISPSTTQALGPAAPSVGMPAAPAAPTRPTIAPVAAAVAPAQPVAAAPAAPIAAPAAPAVPSYSRQALAPARPALSAADVYGGTIGTAQTTSPGTTVSRATSFGPTYTTNQYGAVTATSPDGKTMAALGGIPSPGIAGPLGPQAPSAPGSSLFGPKAKGATGMIAGAALGSYALGPIGAMLGGVIGKNLAQGKPALNGLLGGGNANNPGTRTIDTYAGKMTFANPVGGLGFPSAPSAPKNTYSGSGGGALSNEARDALRSNDGLY
jgi:hypothetical protein